MSRRITTLRWLGAVVMVAGLATTVCPVPTYAGTTTYKMKTAGIVWQGKLFSHPDAFAFGGTTYMPIWYVSQLLKQAGVSSTWDGHTWALTVPKSLSPDLTNLNPGKGPMQVTLNGQLVESVTGLVATDPSSHAKTTFMPIWYIMQVLKRIGVQSTWNGATWSLKQTRDVSLVPGTTKAGFVQDFMLTLGVPADWSVVSASPTTSTKSSTSSSSSTSAGTSSKSGSSKTSSTTKTGTSSSTSGTSSSTSTSKTSSTTTSKSSTSTSASNSKTSSTTSSTSTSKSSTSTSSAEPQVPSTPYDDVKATDDAWAYIHAALTDGFINADSKTHFGSADPVNLTMVDDMYWAWMNMGHAAYEPGGSVASWAQAIGLNPSGVDSTSALTADQVKQVLSNLKALQQGFKQTLGSTGASSAGAQPGQWQIYYPPADEYNQTFSQLSANGRPVYSQASASNAIDEVYHFFNSMTVTEAGDNLVVSMPSTVNTLWFAYAGTAGNIDYNLFNGDGASWVTTPSFDGRNIVAADVPANVNQILLRVPKSAGITISLNEQMGSLGGSVSLGEIQISWADGGLQVKRLSLH